MADITLTQLQQLPEDTVLRYRDMGDGTHALVIFSSASLVVNIPPDGGTDPTPQALLVDGIIGSLAVIRSTHYQVHEGGTFRSWYIIPHGSLLADNGNLDIVLTTTTKEPHITFNIGYGGDFEFYIYRTPTVTGGTGTAQTPHNLQDGSSTVSTCSVLLRPTVTNAGTEILGDFTGGGTGGKSVGGNLARQDTEDMFAINTTYLTRVTNRGGSAKQFSILLQWYEEDPPA